MGFGDHTLDFDQKPNHSVPNAHLHLVHPEKALVDKLFKATVRRRIGEIIGRQAPLSDTSKISRFVPVHPFGEKILKLCTSTPSSIIHIRVLDQIQLCQLLWHLHTYNSNTSSSSISSPCSTAASMSGNFLQGGGIEVFFAQIVDNHTDRPLDLRQ